MPSNQTEVIEREAKRRWASEKRIQEEMRTVYADRMINFFSEEWHENNGTAREVLGRYTLTIVPWCNQSDGSDNTEGRGAQSWRWVSHCKRSGKYFEGALW